MPFSLARPRLLIDGQWHDGPAVEPVVNPYSGAVVAEAPVGDAAMLDAAAEAAHKAFERVTRHVPAHERGRLLHAASEEIRRRSKEFADLIVAEAGKPVTLAEGEVARCAMTFAAAADEARRPHGELIAMDALPAGQGHLGLARRFPVGVVYGITPFNFPLNLVAHKVAPAIAAGCSIVIKPAPKTPLSSLLLADVLSGVGLPAGQLNVVTCPNDLAGRLVQDPRVKMVSFTGSPAIGWAIKSAAEKRKVTLELGGNAAVVVCEDADLDAAIPLIATGAFAYAGQSCISVQRVFIQRGTYEPFVGRFTEYVTGRVLAGDPTRRDVLVGPMISPAAAERTLRMIESARSTGAKVLSGGTMSPDGRCVLPTVLADADPKSEACAGEAFAPLVVVAPYDDFEAALSAVNDSAFGLQAGIFTRDIGRALRAFERLEVGGVMVNQVPTFRVEHMPYGGVKDSGFGREGLKYAVEEMTELRSLIVRT